MLQDVESVCGPTSSPVVQRGLGFHSVEPPALTTHTATLSAVRQGAGRPVSEGVGLWSLMDLGLNPDPETD